MLSLSEAKVEELQAKQADLLQELQVTKMKLMSVSEKSGPSKVVCFRK
jgi:hypothetical protein